MQEGYKRNLCEGGGECDSGNGSRGQEFSFSLQCNLLSGLSLQEGEAEAGPVAPAVTVDEKTNGEQQSFMESQMDRNCRVVSVFIIAEPVHEGNMGAND